VPKLPRMTEAEHRTMSARLAEIGVDLDKMDKRIRAGYPTGSGVFRRFYSMEECVSDFVIALKHSLDDHHYPGGLQNELYQGSYRSGRWHASHGAKPLLEILDFTRTDDGEREQDPS